jgi:hypothetical protein
VIKEVLGIACISGYGLMEHEQNRRRLNAILITLSLLATNHRECVNRKLMASM